MSEIKKYQKAMNFKANPRYLTRDFIVPLYTGTEPDILDDSNTQRESSVYKEFPNEMPIVSPKEIQNQPYEQLELADGGRANFSEGSKLTGTDKTLEQNIKSDHKAFNDYRKSIGSPTIPLDNEYIRMWIRTRLNEGGSVERQNYKEAGFVTQGKNAGKWIVRQNNKYKFFDNEKEAKQFAKENTKGYLSEENKKNIKVWEKNTGLNFNKSDLSPSDKWHIKSGIRKGNTEWRSKLYSEKYFQPLSKRGRELVKNLYGIKESDIDAWQKDPINKNKRNRINAGTINKNTVPTNISAYDKDRIIVKSKRGSSFGDTDDVVFPNKQMEKDFIKDVKEKHKVPKSSSEFNTEYFTKNYPIKEQQANRAIRFLRDKFELEYPKGITAKEYNSPEARKERYGDVTSRKIEEKISKTKTPILKEADLSKKIDLAHRVSKRHMNRLGIQFNTDTVGMDSRLINQIIVRPSESALKNLYNKQYNLFNTAKKSRLTNDISNKLNEVNSKIINEVEKTSGRLIGVIVDPDTLETSFHGMKKKLSLDSKGIDLKQLEKMSLEKQTDYLSKVVPKAVNAEIDRGFIPKDFEKILSNPDRQESIIKYARRTAPELVPQLKQIFKDPSSAKSIEIYSGAVPGLEQMIKTPAGRALGTLFTSASKITGAPFNAALGAVLSTSEMREKGLGRLDSVLLGATKGATQDLANFATYVARTPEALYKTFKEDPGAKKVRLEQFLENLGEEKFKFIDEFADKASERLSTKEYIDNLAQLEYEKQLEKVMPSPSISETELFNTDQYLNEELFKKNYRNKFFKQNPEFKEEYNYVNKEPSVTPEGLYNFNVTDLSQPQELQKGGRVQLGEGGGPKIGRRGFLGLLTGVAAAPELIKSIQGTKKAAKTVGTLSKIKLEKTEGMYPWFPDLVEKIKTKGKPFEEKEIIMEASYKHEPKGYGGLPKGEETVTRHVDGDTEFLLREYPDGRIAVDIHSPRNQEGSSTPVTLYYRPTMELKYYDGVKVEPAEFKVLEKEPRYFANGPDDVDIEMSEMRKVPGQNTIYGDVEAAERFATGKIENKRIIAAKQARREQMEDAPTDFIEETSPYGPETF
jgi:hypothetical protein